MFLLRCVSGSVLLLLLLSIQPLFSQSCPPADVPDSLYQDTNFDGIDGDTSHAIFVSASAGSDSNAGTMQAPVATVEKGIQLAQLAGKDVYIAGGTYVPYSALQLVSGVSLYGQYSGPPSWSRSASNNTVIMGPTPAIVASGITAETHVEGLTIKAAAPVAAGASAYGIRIVSGSGAVVLRYDSIWVTSGGNGISGTDGPSGANGGDGGSGSSGACDNQVVTVGGPGGSSICGASGGAGGVGGFSQTNGSSGQAGAGGTTGGSGGAWGNPGSPGGPGTNGQSGNSASNAGPAASSGGFSGGFYLPAAGHAGAAGTFGYGGGGGGGGGGQSCFFCADGTGNAGGGGGGGGCGGGGGQGGLGGGGSFAVFVYNAAAKISSNVIISNNGGSGGHGGNAGQKGLGGSGGSGAANCTGEVGAGGNGGNGGDGGYGGAGSGGTGGPSVGIMVVDSSIVIGNNTIITGSGGFGGAGGISLVFGAAPSGTNGSSSAISGPFTAPPAVTPLACVNSAVITEPTTGSQNMIFTVFLSEVTTDTVKVDFATHDSTAVGGTDYVAASGTIAFPPGVLMQQITVPVNGDVIAEPTEYFVLQLLSAQNGILANPYGVGTILDNPNHLHVLAFTGGWNLVSMPVLAADMSAGALWSDAVSPLISYSTAGGSYTTKDTADVGHGYWLRFNLGDELEVQGAEIVPESIAVSPGWNLIGSLVDTVPVENIETEPAGMLSSAFFGYAGGYEHALTIDPGQGYWVNSDSAGTIILSPPGPGAVKSRIPHKQFAEEGWNALIIRDASGHAQRLAFVDQTSLGNTRPDNFRLPPVPPEGAFDARYASQRSVAVFNRGQVGQFPISISSSSWPVTIRPDWKGEALDARLVVNGIEYSLLKADAVTVTGSSDRVALKIGGTVDIPRRYELAQNYPNPFNPTTIISYGLPEDSHVVLKIYDVLGREVRSLVDDVEPAGFRKIAFDASNLASGIYFYRLSATSTAGSRKAFSSTQKMVVAK